MADANPSTKDSVAAPRLSGISRLIGVIGSYLFFIVVAMIAIEVIARYVFNAPTIWSHELSVLLCATAFVLGGPYVQQQRGHIVISVAQERFSAQWKRRGNVVVSILALLFLTILTFAGIEQALASIAVMEKSGTALNWPIPAILKSLFALSVALMTLQTLLQLGSDLKRLK